MVTKPKPIDNWVKHEIHQGIVWVHKANPEMRVTIHKQIKPNRPTEYYVFHTHPAPTKVILQHPEETKTLKIAMEKAAVHLQHWNDPKKWQSDPDYGKLGLKP